MEVTVRPLGGWRLITCFGTELRMQSNCKSHSTYRKDSDDWAFSWRSSLSLVTPFQIDFLSCPLSFLVSHRWQHNPKYSASARPKNVQEVPAQDIRHFEKSDNNLRTQRILMIPCKISSFEHWHNLKQWHYPWQNCWNKRLIMERDIVLCERYEINCFSRTQSIIFFRPRVKGRGCSIYERLLNFQWVIL